MKKYMLAFFGGNMALRYDNLEKAEKEARKKHMAAWGEWMSELVKAEHLEVGYPLESIARSGLGNRRIIAHYQKWRIHPCASLRRDEVGRPHLQI